jgi:hypothetical protein
MTEPFIDVREKKGVQVFSEDGTKTQLVVFYPTVKSILVAGKNFGESFVQIFCFNDFFSFQPASTALREYYNF